VLTVQKVLALRSIELFSSMSTAELGRLAAITEEVVYPAGSEIIREGDYGDSMFVIVDGEVQIHRGETPIYVCRKNDYFGETTLIDGEPRSASATAITDCLMLRLDQADFHEILSHNFDAALAVMRTLSRRIRRADDQSKTD
jgi:CRP-like cAMP-binding protein